MPRERSLKNYPSLNNKFSIFKNKGQSPFFYWSIARKQVGNRVYFTFKFVHLLAFGNYIMFWLAWHWVLPVLGLVVAFSFWLSLFWNAFVAEISIFLLGTRNSLGYNGHPIFVIKAFLLAYDFAPKTLSRDTLQIFLFQCAAKIHNSECYPPFGHRDYLKVNANAHCINLQIPWTFDELFVIILFLNNWHNSLGKQFFYWNKGTIAKGVT